MSPIVQHDPQTGTVSTVGFRATNGVSVRTKIGYAGEVYYLRTMALDAGSPRTPVLPGDLTISAGVRMVLRTRS